MHSVALENIFQTICLNVSFEMGQNSSSCIDLCTVLYLLQDQDSSVPRMSEEEAISRAIALSLVNEETEEQKAEREREEVRKKAEEEAKAEQEAKEKEKEYDALRAMDKSILEDFSNVLLPSSVELGSVVPECVSRAVDLIVSMAKRNGDEWWRQGLERVRNTVSACMTVLDQSRITVCVNVQSLVTRPF